MTKADIEFYYSGLVLNIAQTLAKKNWDDLTYRSKNRNLDKAIDILDNLFNSKKEVKTLCDMVKFNIFEKILKE